MERKLLADILTYTKFALSAKELYNNERLDDILLIAHLAINQYKQDFEDSKP